MRLVEDGMPMRGDGVGPNLALEEAVDRLPEKMPQLDIGKGVVIGRSVLERRQTLAPFVEIRYGLGRQNTVAVLIYITECQVDAVERRTRHQSKNLHFSPVKLECKDTQKIPLMHKTI